MTTFEDFLSNSLKTIETNSLSIYKDLFKISLQFSLSGIEIKNKIHSSNINLLNNKTGIKNSDNDLTKELDEITDKIIIDNLKKTKVRFYASEENIEPITININGSFVVNTDPLDGSSNIGVNAPIGTIFSIFKAKNDEKDSVLQIGRNILASGYILYGPNTLLIFSFGKGTFVFQLDKKNQFILLSSNIQIPTQTNEFSINISNYNHWSTSIKKYVDDILKGEEGIRRKQFNMRWVASLVADAYRIFCRGGIFLYPSDFRQGYEKGRLRLVYEAIPIAFLIENANGKATDGYNSILDIKPNFLHQRTPFIFGSKNEVDYLTSKYMNINN